jgi:DNA ligase 1
VLFERIVSTSESIAATRAKKKKVELIARLLSEAAADEQAITARYLSGEVALKLGVGYATVFQLREQVAPASEASLSVREVAGRLADIAALSGAGSATGKKQGFGELLARSTQAEQAFLGGLVLGEIRQGALDSLVVDAIAMAKELEPRAVRAAYMLAGEIGALAEAVLAEGAAALSRFGLTLFRPVLPMLAQTADDAASAIASFGGPAVVEHKLDGFRVQIHKAESEVRIYSRALNDVTASVPEIVEMVRALPARRLILDGEAIAYGDDGRPLPFQDTMKLLAKNRPTGSAPLSLSLFDLLLVDDQTLLAKSGSERFAALDAIAPQYELGRLLTRDGAEAQAFFEAAIKSGHEGVMLKALDAPYEAGSRGAAWLKLKKIHRLDLVVLAVEWGSGRRHGTLSNLHLGARDPRADGSNGWVMLGKTFKGMTDEVLAWQTKELLLRQTGREGHIVHVRPELVVEIAFNDVQRSSQYPGGFALRHARLVRYRGDKTAAEADTIDAVRAIAVADGVIR